MSRLKAEHIPGDVLASAKRANVKAPLWYAGQITDQEVELECTIDEVVIAARGHRALGVSVHDALRENIPQQNNQ